METSWIFISAAAFWSALPVYNTAFGNVTVKGIVTCKVDCPVRLQEGFALYLDGEDEPKEREEEEQCQNPLPVQGGRAEVNANKLTVHKRRSPIATVAAR